ncbi:peptidyl-tRNA hydrolase ICT1, mitochondrial-like [Anneissia japonica]|uniref:peptidyl-tRNA hydrolase ICT1, mitochondrial-like n=1 Tax=Anneissia japonica TaxID=1529436 RepID=UPI001425B896|nr:peptidyl-tRNA hydrolase ICT1, mitochondrial-like [Anneissia japonica]
MLRYPLTCMCRNIRSYAQVRHFKSAYSLEKLYPNSNTDDIAVRYSAAEGGENEQEQFSGYIPVDKLCVKHSKSSGPGGQNVNKVNSKVEVRFNVAESDWLPKHIQDKLLEKKKTKVTVAGDFYVTSDRTRSQMTNFADCLQKIRDAIAEVTREPKEPSDKDKAVLRMRVERNHRERLKAKKIHSSKKIDRKIYVD